MDCERILDLLPGHLDATLEEPERAAVEAHLRECPRCAAEEGALKETLALLRTLPPVKAPPAFLEGVRERIAAERPATAGAGRFASFRFRIPLEAAAAVLLFLLVYGIQRQFPATEPPPGPPAHAETAAPAGTRDLRPAPSAKPPGEVPTAVVLSPGRGGDGKEQAGFAEDRGEAAADRSRFPAAARKEASAAKTALPAVPATRVSTGAESFAPRPMEEPKSEPPAPFRVFAAPPSRLARPLPYGRELILEVAAADRAGIEERILRAVERFGGSALREFHFRGPQAGEGAGITAAEGPMRVKLPADAAEPFLSELRNLGIVPPEGMPATLDLPAGPTPDTVAYTIRIRVR